MNPVRRSALAIAATCGAVALAPVVDAAPLTVPADGVSGADASTGSAAAVPTPAADGCAPSTSAPVPSVPTSTTVAPPVETVPPTSTTIAGSTPPPSTDCPPTSTTTSTTTTSTTTTTVPGSSTVPSTTGTTSPTTSPTTTENALPPVEGSVPPGEPATSEVPSTETTTTLAGATASATAVSQSTTGATGGVAPISASTPNVIATEPNPPLPPQNPAWTTEGVPRFVVPRIPGSTSLQPGRTPAGERVVLAENVDVILATIRQLESSGRYDIGPNRALASGAYQYIPGTWNNYGGYPEAYLAPPEVQDERARIDVERILSMYGGNVSMVPVMWYYPRAAVEPLWMDRVPNPAGGNRLTIREYQTLWLERLDQNASALLGTYVTAPAVPAALTVVSDTPAPTTTVPIDPLAPVAAVADEPVVIPPHDRPADHRPADHRPADHGAGRCFGTHRADPARGPAHRPTGTHHHRPATADRQR